MPRRQDPSARPDSRRLLDRLRALSLDPARQREVARELIAGESDPFVIEAALKVLGENLGPPEREALVGRYAILDANGPRNDPGGHSRATIIDALRHVATDDDIAIFERAALTEEFSFQGGTPALQAAGLLALADRAPERASLIAIRLLTGRTRALTPEPALSAARLLSAGDNVMPLFTFLSLHMRDGFVAHPDVLAEALKGIRTLPGDLLEPIFAAYSEHDDDIVLLGLCDLAIEHGSDPVTGGFIRHFMAGTDRYDVYHYLCTAMVATHRADLLALLLEAGPLETDRLKLKSLAEALELVVREPGVGHALAGLRDKLGATPLGSGTRPARGRDARGTEIVHEDDEDIETRA